MIRKLTLLVSLTLFTYCQSKKQTVKTEQKTFQNKNVTNIKIYESDTIFDMRLV
jgi:hypothetical protein